MLLDELIHRIEVLFRENEEMVDGVVVVEGGNIVATNGKDSFILYRGDTHASAI